MKGDMLPDSDHIVRYCRPGQIVDGRVQASAFLLRNGEDFLSVNWVEKIGVSDADLMKAMKRIFQDKIKVSNNGKLVKLQVGGIIEHVLENAVDNRKLEIKHEPEPDNDSHSGIYNMRPMNELIAELILQLVTEANTFSFDAPM